MECGRMLNWCKVRLPIALDGWPVFISLSVVFLDFVQVMNWFSSLRFMIKCLSPFFLGIKKGYVKNPLFPGPTSMVPSDSIDMTSEAIMVSWVLGIFTSHLKVGSTRGVFWFNCNWCPCIMPNTERSSVLLVIPFPLCGSSHLGRLISRPYLPIKNNGSQDPKFKLFWHISLQEKEVVLKGPCWGGLAVGWVSLCWATSLR